MEIKSYLTSDFISEFLKNRPGDDLSENKIPWLTLYQFFNNKTILNIDCDPAELVKYINDPVFRNVIDLYLQSSEKVNLLDWKQSIFSSNEFDFPFKFCFNGIKDSKFSNRCSDNGIVASSSSDWIKIRKMTTPVTLTLTNENENFKFKSWSDLKSKMLPFHSIIICDNYLMANYDFTFKNNFGALLSTILKDTKEQPVNQITIFTNDFLPRPDRNLKKETRQLMMDEKYFPIVHDRVKTLINELGLKNFELSIVKTKLPSDYHDRHIFTNSQFIKSENSFNNYFDRDNKVNSRSPIQLSILSYPSDNNKNTWGESIIPNLKTLFKIINEPNVKYLGVHPLQNLLFRSLK